MRYGPILGTLRFLQIFRKNNTLKFLLTTIVFSIIRSTFIVIAIACTMLAYALIGIILFGNVKYGEAVGTRANFETSGIVVITLVRVTTGEDWHKIMRDYLEVEPHCVNNDRNYWESNCGNPIAAVIYFFTFYVLIVYILLNLFIAIILENFSLFYTSEEELLTHTQIKQFQSAWYILDSRCKGQIKTDKCKILIYMLTNKLAATTGLSSFKQKEILKELHKVSKNGFITFHEVLNVIAYRTINLKKHLQWEEIYLRESLEASISQEVARNVISNWMVCQLTKMRQMKERSNRTPSIVFNNFQQHGD